MPKKKKNIIDQLHTVECFNNHMAEWMIEPKYLQMAVSRIKSGLFKADEKAQEETRERGSNLRVTSQGIAIIPIFGQIQKGVSKHGGTSSVMTRSLVREAMNDPDVEAIFLHIDSPGGTVAGTDELAGDIAKAAEQMLVHAHIDDLGASAAFWIATAASRITANRTGQVGSIGTVVVVEDTSEAAKMAGVKVHVISTGGFKGSFADGVKITKDELKMLQDRVDDLNAIFLAAVAEGREMALKHVKRLADGRIHIAEKAKALGLIDEVSSFEESFKFLMATLSEQQDPEVPGASHQRKESRFSSETIESYCAESEIMRRALKFKQEEIS